MSKIKEVLTENTYIPLTFVAALVVSVAGGAFWLADVNAKVTVNTERIKKIDEIADDVAYIKGYIKALKDSEEGR